MRRDTRRSFLQAVARRRLLGHERQARAGGGSGPAGLGSVAGVAGGPARARRHGACRHLRGLPVPSIKLRSTRGRWVDLSAERAARVVVYCYPRTGVPGQPLLPGWDAIPGARGCTPETCAFLY